MQPPFLKTKKKKSCVNNRQNKTQAACNENKTEENMNKWVDNEVKALWVIYVTVEIQCNFNSPNDGCLTVSHFSVPISSVNTNTKKVLVGV